MNMCNLETGQGGRWNRLLQMMVIHIQVLSLLLMSSGCPTRRSTRSKERQECPCYPHHHEPCKAIASRAVAALTHLPVEKKKGKEATSEGSWCWSGKQSVFGGGWRGCGWTQVLRLLWWCMGWGEVFIRDLMWEAKQTLWQTKSKLLRPQCIQATSNGWDYVLHAGLPYLLLNCLSLSFINTMKTSRWKQNTNEYMWATKLSSSGILFSHKW